MGQLDGPRPVGYASVSEELGRDVAHVLLRLGVRSSACGIATGRIDRGERRPAFERRDRRSTLTRPTPCRSRCGTTSSRRRVTCRGPRSTDGVGRPHEPQLASVPRPRAPRDRRPAGRGARRRPAAVVGVARRRVGPDRRDHGRGSDRGHRLHRARPPQLRRRRRLPPQHRVRARHGRARGPDDRPSRCSCSRWRWATTS